MILRVEEEEEGRCEARALRRYLLALEALAAASVAVNHCPQLSIKNNTCSLQAGSGSPVFGECLFALPASG